MRGSCEQTRWKASPRSNRYTRSTRSPWSRWTGRRFRWRACSLIMVFGNKYSTPYYSDSSKLFEQCKLESINWHLTLGWQDQGGAGWCAKFPFNCSSSTTRSLWGSTTLAKTASHILKVKLYLCQSTNGHLQAKQPDILGSPRSNKVAFIFYSRHYQERNQPKS